MEDKKGINLSNFQYVLNSIPEIFLFEVPKNYHEAQIVKGICQGYDFILGKLGEDITDGDLLYLNRVIQGGFSVYNSSNPNPYRSTQAKIINFKNDPPHPMYVSKLMNRVLYLLSNQSDLSALEKAALAQGGIQYIQPFEDGNKRVGRLLSDKVLFENNLKTPIYNQRDNYIELLHKVYTGISPLVKDTNFNEIYDKNVYEPLINYLKKFQ